MKKAVEYFKQGYSCSESMIKAAINKGLVHESVLPLASGFSGGMGSGCVCGALAGVQIIIGAMYGRDDNERDGKKARELAKKAVEMFKEKNKVTCCKVLTAGLIMASPERKQHCCTMVNDAVEIVEKLLEIKSSKD